MEYTQMVTCRATQTHRIHPSTHNHNHGPGVPSTIDLVVFLTKLLLKYRKEGF